MEHHHHHGHHHGPANYSRAFAAGVALNGAYILLEAGFGFWSGSLALLSDASHNLSDVLGLLLAWGGHVLAQLPPSERRTYGWRSSTILAALSNALILLFVTGGIAWEALRRFFSPAEVQGTVVIIVAAVGVVINTLTALLFLRGRKEDLNIRGAYLHMAADAGISLAVVIAGLGIRFTGWTWIDPVASLMIALVIGVGTWELLRESLDLAMQAVPKGFEPAEVQRTLLALDGVIAV
ncbi:MAG: cation diffusion facilitator family transporter, partial [Planctomycetaceae bacterium]